MDGDKIEAVQEWPLPRSVKALRGFLGLTGYHRRFITNYGAITTPLTALLKEVFHWTPDATAAFDALKLALTTSLVLQLPNFDEPFIVDCDASGSGFGVVLHQGRGPIAFFGKQCTPSTPSSPPTNGSLLDLYRQCAIGALTSGCDRSSSAPTTAASNTSWIPQHTWVSKLFGYTFQV
jgi:hypothetical protein